METNHKLINVGNYVLTNRKLGEGSFSKVKVAHHKVLQKEVAMKIIKKSSIKDPYVAKNLEREAQILSTLNHINVVRLFEIVQCEGLYCIIMEFFPGGSVCDLVQSRGKLNEVISRRFFSQMITGLSYIHKMGIVHRDLKLENLLLTRNMRNLVIADFGLSNFWDANVRLKTYCGSPEYAAPELFAKAEYTQKIDIWSAGICLYALSTAKLPFDIDDSVPSYLGALTRAITRGYGAKHEAALAGVSIELKVLIAKILCVNPDHRVDIDYISTDPWVTDSGEKRLGNLEENTLSEEETKLIVNGCRENLGIKKLSTKTILDYVNSKKGMFGKTAGCFNILKREHEISKESALVVTAKPVTVRNPNLKLQDYARTPDRKRKLDPQVKLCDGSSGNKPSDALTKVRPHAPPRKHLFSTTKPSETKRGRNLRGSSEDTAAKTVEVENSCVNGIWRRSIKPQMIGECKHTRLKRVVGEESKVLKNRDLNRL